MISIILGTVIALYVVCIYHAYRIKDLKEIEEKVDTVYYSTYIQERLEILEKELGYQKKDYYPFCIGYKFADDVNNTPYEIAYHIYYGYGGKKDFFSNKKLNELYPEKFICKLVLTMEENENFQEIYNQVVEEHKNSLGINV